MTDKEIMEHYDVNEETVKMLRMCCDVGTLNNIDLIYYIANIKILQHRLIEAGLTPDIAGCEKFIKRRTSDNVVIDALKSQ